MGTREKAKKRSRSTLVPPIIPLSRFSLVSRARKFVPITHQDPFRKFPTTEESIFFGGGGGSPVEIFSCKFPSQQRNSAKTAFKTERFPSNSSANWSDVWTCLGALKNDPPAPGPWVGHYWPRTTERWNTENLK